MPPAAAPLTLSDLLHGLAGILFGRTLGKKRERELGEYFGVRHVYLTSSGKAALAVILKALKRLAPERNQVLIPAYTCFSVPSAIMKAGLQVSLCDMDPAAFDFDYALLKKTIGKKTLCVVPTHLFGVPADMDRTCAVCRDEGVFVVEDAAQAMGGNYKGRKLGTIGDAGIFSLGRGKNITCGAGGIIVTNSDAIAREIGREYARIETPGITEGLKELAKTALMALFIHPSLYWLPAGLPFLGLGKTVFSRKFPVKTLSGIQAGLLRNWRSRLEKSNRVREENTKYYLERLQPFTAFTEGTVSAPLLRLPLRTGNRAERERICELPGMKGMGLGMMYPGAIHEIKQLRSRFIGKRFPAAAALAEELLSVPTHHLLSRRDKERICELLKKAAALPLQKDPGLMPVNPS